MNNRDLQESGKTRLETEMEKAESIAESLNKLVLGQEFTMQHIASLMKIGVNDATNRISFIAGFGCISMRIQEKTQYFKIVMDKTERKSILLQSITLIREQSDRTCENLLKMIDLISATNLKIVN